MPLFDRTKQLHVIQDLRCYLCDVKVYVSKAINLECDFAFNRSFSCHEKVAFNNDIMNLNLVALKLNTVVFATSVWKTLITTANG